MSNKMPAMESEVFVVGTPRADGGMPYPEKLIGHPDPCIFLSQDGADKLCETESLKANYQFKVFKAIFYVTHEVPLKGKKDPA